MIIRDCREQYTSVQQQEDPDSGPFERASIVAFATQGLPGAFLFCSHAIPHRAWCRR
jgi:hypothetical protein